MKTIIRNPIIFPFLIRISFWGWLLILLGASCTKVEDKPLPANLGTAAGSFPPPPPPPPSPITIYQAIPTFSVSASIMAEALRRTGIDSMLDGKGPFTLIVPNDIAFANIGITHDLISTMPLDSLREIVLNHIVVGDSTLLNGIHGRNMKVLTAAGDSIFVSIKDDQYIINTNIVEHTGIDVSNGTIFWSSNVMMPLKKNIMQRLEEDLGYAFFVAAVHQASQGTIDLYSILSAQVVSTVFIPSNQSFRNAGFSSISNIKATNPDTLARLLSYHIVRGRFFYTDLMSSEYKTQYPTLGGSQLTVINEKIEDVWGDYTIPNLLGNGNMENAIFLETDRMATNGVIHMINKVLQP